RAIRKAWLLGSVVNNSKNQPKIVDGSLLSCLWPALQPFDSNVRLIAGPGNAVAMAAPEAQEPPPLANTLLSTRHLPVNWQHPSAIASAEEITANSSESAILPNDNQAERLRGDILHYCLKQVAEQKLSLQD